MHFMHEPESAYPIFEATWKNAYCLTFFWIAAWKKILAIVLRQLGAKTESIELKCGKTIPNESTAAIYKPHRDSACCFRVPKFSNAEFYQKKTLDARS